MEIIRNFNTYKFKFALCKKNNIKIKSSLENEIT